MSIWTAGKRYLEKVRKRKEIERERAKRLKYEKREENEEEEKKKEEILI